MKIIQWACLLSFLPLLTSCNPGPPVEIPKAAEITEMQVDIELNGITDWMTQKEVERQKFSASKEHWKPILDAFRPYKRGVTWEKGYVPGDITLTLKDGTTFTIEVLVFGTPDAMHFWLGPEYITHIGGSPSKLRDALKAAYITSQESDAGGG